VASASTIPIPPSQPLSIPAPSITDTRLGGAVKALSFST
jgi:hypothetical protein